MWPWTATWPEPTICAQCEKAIPASGSILCAACTEHPKLFNESQAAFCSQNCQQLSRLTSSPHFKDCVKLQQRIILNRIAKIAQEAFLVYREICYDELILDFFVDQREPLHCTIVPVTVWDPAVNGALFPTQFDHHDKEDRARRAVLCHAQSRRALVCTSIYMKIVSNMLKIHVLEASCKVRDDFRPITILDPRGDDCYDWLGYLVMAEEKWLIDLTGAQYGFQLPLVAWEFVVAFQEVHGLKPMQSRSTDTNQRMDKAFATMLGSWAGSYTKETFSALLSSENETFEGVLKDLLNGIKQNMTAWVGDHRSEIYLSCFTPGD